MKFTKYQFNFNEAPRQGSGWGLRPHRASDSMAVGGNQRLARSNTFHLTSFVHICSWIIPFSTLPNHWRRRQGREGPALLRAPAGLGPRPRACTRLLPGDPGPFGALVSLSPPQPSPHPHSSEAPALSPFRDHVAAPQPASTLLEPPPHLPEASPAPSPGWGQLSGLAPASDG